MTSGPTKVHHGEPAPSAISQIAHQKTASPK